MKKSFYIIIVLALSFLAFLSYANNSEEETIIIANNQQDIEEQELELDSEEEDFVEENPDLTQFDEETIIAQ